MAAESRHKGRGINDPRLRRHPLLHKPYLRLLLRIGSILISHIRLKSEYGFADTLS